MKSAQLVTFLTIASLSVSCSPQKINVDDTGFSVQSQTSSVQEVPGVYVSIEARQSQSHTSQVASTSANGLEGFVSNTTSPLPKSQQSDVTQQPLKGFGGAPTPPKSSILSPTKTGRDNPFALAEQPEFEVRFLAAKASTSLPPIPSVGLGPEPGASLRPVPLVAEPIELRPAMPTLLVPQEPSSTSIIPPNSPLGLSPSSVLSPVESPVVILPPAISPTALAEAVEIRGVVQLGDQIAVIINEGEGALSRTVQPGARLVGGQVELRRIDTTTAEPQVVLMQNGVEIIRGIGV